MVSIITSENKKSEVEKILHSAPQHYKKLIKLSPKIEDVESDFFLVVNEKGIHWPLFWSDHFPPYLIPATPLTRSNFLSLAGFLIEKNTQAIQQLLDKNVLEKDFNILEALLNGTPIPKNAIEHLRKEKLKSKEHAFIYSHNEAIIKHYGSIDKNIEDVLLAYKTADELVTNPEWQAYTNKHFGTLLLDIGLPEEAENKMRKLIDVSLSEDAQMALKQILSDALIQKLVVPYKELALIEIKSLLQDSIEYEKKKGNKVKIAQCYTQAAHIALIDEHYSEALGYINSALAHLEEREDEEFTARVYMQKGEILYVWAQNGHPQFYKTSIEAYQQALNTFSQDKWPEAFARIHHQLGILYANYPTEDKKKGIMAGLAQNSFNIALQYFTKEDFPYEYAAICSHFGNALCKFPPTIHSDKFEKALNYYNEALQIRTTQYPYERALTLLNYIEACWNIRNEKTNGQDRWLDMKQKAEEVLQLVEDENLRAEAQRHLQGLQQLKKLSEK